MINSNNTVSPFVRMLASLFGILAVFSPMSHDAQVIVKPIRTVIIPPLNVPDMATTFDREVTFDITNLYKAPIIVYGLSVGGEFDPVRLLQSFDIKKRAWTTPGSAPRVGSWVLSSIYVDDAQTIQSGKDLTFRKQFSNKLRCGESLRVSIWYRDIRSQRVRESASSPFSFGKC